MSNYQGASTWENEVYLIAENDPVQGGIDGVDNLPHKQLANRTAFLKQKVEAVEKKVDGITIPADQSQAIQTLQNGLANEIKARENADKTIVGQPSEQVTLAILLERLKQVEQRPYVIPVGGLFETAKAYADGVELAKDMGYGVWREYGRGRVTVGATTQKMGNLNGIDQAKDTITDKAGNVLLAQIGYEDGEISHVLSVQEIPDHKHKFVNSLDGDIRDNSRQFALGLKDDIDFETLVSKEFAYSPDVTSDSQFLQSTKAGVGGDQPHNNMQPFVVVGRWIRTA